MACNTLFSVQCGANGRETAGTLIVLLERPEYRISIVQLDTVLRRPFCGDGALNGPRFSRTVLVSDSKDMVGATRTPDLCRVNFEVTHLKPIPYLAFPQIIGSKWVQNSLVLMAN